MKGLVLAKEDLPEGWIGAAVGEPYIVKENLFKIFNPPELNLTDKSVFEYSKPQGYDPLVKYLQDKHQAPVVISNGAKQAIGALFFALKQQGIQDIYLKKPWWSLFPPLIKMHGLNQTENVLEPNMAHLLVSPNNPDGSGQSILNNVNAEYVIHDAAYYNHVYLPREAPLNALGSVQVFTCSKLFGLSQLRVGYSVFYNTDLYSSVLEYMEHMTVGASVLSQMYAYELFHEMSANPSKKLDFENKCYDHLSLNRLYVNTLVNPSVLEIDHNQTGMFLWAKCHNVKIFDDAKIMVVEGTPFGMPGYIRMNLALPSHQIGEIVRRINALSD